MRCGTIDGMKIWSTALSTLGVMFLVFSYGIGLFGFLFPNAMIGLSLDLGLARPAAMFQERVYRRDPTAQNMYLALDRNIHARRHNRVIHFSDKFFAHEDMQTVIDQINTFMWNEAIAAGLPPEMRALVSNQLSRLRSAYVYSLLELGKGSHIVVFLDYAALTSNLSITQGDRRIIDNLQQPCFAYLDHWQRMPHGQRLAARGDFEKYLDEFERLLDQHRAAMTANELLIPNTFITIAREYFAQS